MATAKSITGLLARYQHDIGGFAFATGDWTPASGMTLSLQSGYLQVVGPSGAWGFAQLDTVASRSKVFVYARARTNTATGNAFAATAAHVADPAGSFQAVCIAALIEGTTDFLSEFAGGSGVGSSSGTSGSSRVFDTDYAFSILVNGTAAEVRDYFGDVTLTRTLTISSGRPGVGVFSNNTVRYAHFYVFTDRVVRVSGVPSGGSAEIRTADDTVLASAAETGGVATIEVQTTDVPIELAKKIVWKNSGGTVVDTYNCTGDEIIEPGGLYVKDFAFTAPIAADYDIADAVDIDWTAATGTYNLYYSRNHQDNVTIASDLSDTEYPDWIAPLAGHYRFFVQPVVDGVAGELIESERIRVTRTTAGTPRTHTEVVAASGAEELWNLEQTTGDYLTALDHGYDATAGDTDPGGGGGVEFTSRSEEGICLCPKTVGGTLAADFLATQHPGEIGLYANGFACAVWAHPLGNSAVLGGPHLMLIRPAHAGEPQITDAWNALGLDLGNTFVQQNGMYGMGLSVERGRVAVLLYSHNFFPTKVTWFDPTELLTLELHDFFVIVDVREVSGIDYLRIRLFLDNVYCDALDGTYVELDHPLGLTGAPISGHTGAQRLSWVGTWPELGSDFHEADLLGNRYNGYFDSPAFWAFAPDDSVVSSHYLSGRASLVATQVGAFQAIEAEYEAGDVVPLVWDGVSGADEYLLELELDGTYTEFAVVSGTSLDAVLPMVTADVARFRVRPLYDGYAPELCVGAHRVTSTFSIAAFCPYSIVFWGGWTPAAA